MDNIYDFKKIEEKWNKIWKEKNYFHFDINSKKTKFYNLAMFPYPSAAALHIGHAFTFSGIDVLGRYKRHLGMNVFQPFGFDAFGIHGENYAIKVNRHPSDVLEENVKNFKHQMDRLATIFDWSHSVNTTYPEYYKWTQWIFVQLFKKGLAVRKKAEVNWCPSCKTVLSDEQVIQGKCERCSTLTEKKEMLQWFFKISEYAERLLENSNNIDWSKKTLLMQRNWIGKSEGAIINFKLESSEDLIEAFTTRIDTIFGASFIVVSSKHEIIKNVKEDYSNEVDDFIRLNDSKTNLDLQKEKLGVFTGLYAINPVNNSKVPVYIANYVLSNYGTGALMGVPAHDQRDYDFAIKYKIPILKVIESDKLPYVEEGILINSEAYNGLESAIARESILNKLELEKKAFFKITYKLRDWLVSRQRYWGPPIPIIYCDDCGTLPVEDLPVFLPYLEDFKPSGDGNSPLANIDSFVNTTCPKCGGKARRETDVLDNFVDSSWYFLRYPSVGIDNEAFNKEINEKWLPVDMYIGGNEHAVLHLMYTRFIIMALYDMGYLGFEEPFKKFRAHGLILKDGMKMSKSKGNVINPEEYLDKYGTDVLRVYLLFIGPFSEGGNFSNQNIQGIIRFLYRIWELQNLKISDKPKNGEVDLVTISELSIEITESIENLRYNNAIAKIMEYTNWIYTNYSLLSSNDYKKVVKDLLVMLSCFAPYITEELWNIFGYSNNLIDEEWPKIKVIERKLLLIPVQINGKVRSMITVEKDLSEKEIVQRALNDEKIIKYISENKYKKYLYVKNKILNFVL